MNNELYHHGIRGMKWGVRRYQNKDGSLTPAGKKRMYREMFDSESKDLKERRKYTADASRWMKEDTERSKRLADSSRNLTNDLKRAVDTSSKNRKVPKMDLSTMSDKEMRDQINRAYLEKQYDELFNPKRESKGREYVSRTLETAGNVLAITSSALGIALAIKELKG